jgi:hypothetical protein
MAKLMKCGGVQKHIVIKWADFVKYINNGFKTAMLKNDLEDIQAGRKADGKEPCPEYIVVNTDEPYANEIIEVLKQHGAWGDLKGGAAE